jgi:hypothetical protein
MNRIATAALLVLFATAPAGAQQQPTDTENGRYMFDRSQDNFVRLDTRTGQVAVCGRRTTGWTCEAIAEERTALEAEIARLQGDNATLKKELMSRGLPLPGTVKPDAPAPVAKNRESELKLPSQADVDRMMSFMENVWRRMVEMITNFQKDLLKKT